MRDITDPFAALCSAAVCVTQFFRDTSTPLINSFLGLKARSRRFKCSVQRVCVSWFGTIKLLGVVHGFDTAIPVTDTY